MRIVDFDMFAESLATSNTERDLPSSPAQKHCDVVGMHRPKFRKADPDT